MISSRTKKSSKDGDNSPGFRALFHKFTPKKELSVSSTIPRIPTIEPTLHAALKLSPIVLKSQVKDSGSLVSAFETGKEASLEEFQTTINQDLLDQHDDDNAKQSLKAVGNTMFQAGSNVIVVKETADKVLSVAKEVPGAKEVLSKMIQLASQVAEIGKAVPFIAPAFEILKIIIDIEQKARDADEKCRDLMESICFIVSHMLIIRNIEVSDILKTTLDNIQEVLKEAAALIKAYRDQDAVARRLKVWKTLDFESLTGKIQKCSENLMLSLQVNQTKTLKLLESTLPVLPTMDQVRTALQDYYNKDLVILRISGEPLPLESCYINLAIVEAPEQRKADEEQLKAQTRIYHRMSSYEKIANTNMTVPVALENLFDQRKLRNGKEDFPKRILIQGRAGIGKSTLCKKLVYAFQNGLWKERFDAVLWLSLRQLKGFTSRNLGDLLCEKYFAKQHPKTLKDGLAQTLANDPDRILFLLDGLDEIITDPGAAQGTALNDFLHDLLGQQHVIITSRPSGVTSSTLNTMDLELETVGFSQQDVQEYLRKVEPEVATEIQNFIDQTPLLQGLVNIPVQLDVLCYSWDLFSSSIGKNKSITMASLYQAMVTKLWSKDGPRLGKKDGEVILTSDQILSLSLTDIEEQLVPKEHEYLCYLAFRGFQDNRIEFDTKYLNCISQELNKHRTKSKKERLSLILTDGLKNTSFLHSAADAELDKSKHTWYFLHLTFQEFFAAKWLLRHLQEYLPDPTASSSELMMSREKALEIVQQHKYNPRYEVIWWMVAGLLEDKALSGFFNLLEEAPHDLIGGRHQQILMECFNEAHSQLDKEAVAKVELQLMQWLHFEIKLISDQSLRESYLGRQRVFPEDLVLKSLARFGDQKVLFMTLGARPKLSESAVHVLFNAFQDTDENVRSSAAFALGKQSTLSESAIQGLLNALQHADDDVRRSAAHSLGKQFALSESSIQCLLNALQDAVKYVRRQVAMVLGNQPTLSESAVQGLLNAFQHADYDVRRQGTKVLGYQSILSESAIRGLLNALQDADGIVRSSAARALGNQSTLSESAVQGLLMALQDPDKGVRYQAAFALGNQPTLSESAFYALLNALQDASEIVRASAAIALGKQSTLSESAIQGLLIALQDADDNVRSSAVFALGEHSTLSESAIQGLLNALQDADEYVRYGTATALGNQSTLSESAFQGLLNALQDADASVKRSAAEALGKHSTLSESAIQSLLNALQHRDENVRKSAAYTLGKQSTLSECAIQSLLNALQHADGNV
ncbi:hypothetical protein BGZ83_011880, partial [Gryganskiella cystojenkinii]